MVCTDCRGFRTEGNSSDGNFKGMASVTGTGYRHRHRHRHKGADGGR